MSLLSGLTTDENINTESDNLGGGGPLESGVYKAKITMAYLNKSKGGALSLNLHFQNEDSREFRQTLWIASGDAKGNKNYYENDKGEKNYLPGFLHADAICRLSVGEELKNMGTEMKVVNVYSPEASKEVPTQVEVLMDLLGQEVLVGLIKQTVDKRAKADDGSYQPTGETRDENEIDKIFRVRDGLTVPEIRAHKEESEFLGRWKEKWTGVTRDRTSKQGGNTGQAGAPNRPAANQAGGAAAGGQRKSLFA